MATPRAIWVRNKREQVGVSRVRANVGLDAVALATAFSFPSTFRPVWPGKKWQGSESINGG
jgi:hypothetical protein